MAHNTLKYQYICHMSSQCAWCTTWTSKYQRIGGANYKIMITDKYINISSPVGG